MDILHGFCTREGEVIVFTTKLASYSLVCFDCSVIFFRLCIKRDSCVYEAEHVSEGQDLPRSPRPEQ